MARGQWLNPTHPLREREGSLDYYEGGGWRLSPLKRGGWRGLRQPLPLLASLSTGGCRRRRAAAAATQPFRYVIM